MRRVALSPLESPVSGQGTFDIGANNNAVRRGTIEFGDAVGRGETVQLNAGLLMLDEPKKFLGTIENFNPASTIELVDTRATRADFRDGVLKLFDHHRLVAALDISGDFLSNQFQINHRHGDTFVTVGAVSSDTDRT